MKRTGQDCEHCSTGAGPLEAALQNCKMELESLINDFRAEKKLQPLRRNKNLERIARLRLEGLLCVKNTPSSSRKAFIEEQSVTVEQWMQRCDFNVPVVETTEFASKERRMDNVHRLVLLQTNLFNYRRNLLDQGFTDIGIAGMPGTDGQLYWTVIFATVSCPAQYHRTIRE